MDKLRGGNQHTRGIVGNCASSYPSTPGQGCANNIWVCPITLSTSGIAINGTGTKVCTQMTFVTVSASGTQQGVLYGRFSNTVTVASVSGGNSYIGFAERMANPSGTSAGSLGCYQIGLFTWHEDSSTGAFTPDPVTYYSPTRPGYASTCVAAEASGFFPEPSTRLITPKTRVPICFVIPLTSTGKRVGVGKATASIS